MGVWIGALLSYTMALAPRAGRLFVLGCAASGLGQLADELFVVMYEARTRGLAVQRPVGTEPGQEEVCPVCAQAVPQEAEECPTCGAPVEGHPGTARVA